MSEHMELGVCSSVAVMTATMPQSQIAACVQTLAIQSRLSDTHPPALSQERLEAEKREAQGQLMDALQLRAELDTQLHLDMSYLHTESSTVPQRTGFPATSWGNDESKTAAINLQMERYVELHDRLNRAQETGCQ